MNIDTKLSIGNSLSAVAVTAYAYINNVLIFPVNFLIYFCILLLFVHIIKKTHTDTCTTLLAQG